MVFLPEALDVIGRHKEETVSLTSTETDGVFIDPLRESARRHNIWISIGGYHEKVIHPFIEISISRFHWFLVQIGSFFSKTSRHQLPAYCNTLMPRKSM